MTKRKNYSPEEQANLISFFFEETAKHITPNFSKKDWLDLHKRAHEGDLTSMQMFIALEKEKCRLENQRLKANKEEE